jgi:hypothetical protein
MDGAPRYWPKLLIAGVVSGVVSAITYLLGLGAAWFFGWMAALLLVFYVVGWLAAAF